MSELDDAIRIMNLSKELTQERERRESAEKALDKIRESMFQAPKFLLFAKKLSREHFKKYEEKK